MKNIFDTYMENAFNGEYIQSTEKVSIFDYNYLKFFPNDKTVNILDIGVGRGEMLYCFKKFGYINYMGVDISPSTINYCKTLSLNCILVKDTVKWLEDNLNKYELITLLDVLEHIKKDNVYDFLSAVRNALKKDGTLIIQVPNLQCPDGQLHMYNDFTHEFGYVEHSLRQVLTIVGFSNIQFYGLETLIKMDLKHITKRILREAYRKYVKITRKINENLNPSILDPVFFAIIKKV